MHPHLTVSMHISLDGDFVLQRVSLQVFGFCIVPRGGAHEGVRAGVVAGTSSVPMGSLDSLPSKNCFTKNIHKWHRAVPFVRIVAVEVCADARAARVGFPGFSPHVILCHRVPRDDLTPSLRGWKLRVSVRIHDWENVEVIGILPT